jgi:hypothetical protein
MPSQLLTSQKNRIFSIVEAAGFDPRAFAWTVVRENWTGWDEEVPVLTHVPTGFFCAISDHPAPPSFAARRGNALFQIQVSPGEQYQTEERSALGDFEAVCHEVAMWLTRIRREDIPDQWQALEASRTLVGSVIEREPDNAPFNEAELVRVAAALGELRAVAARLELGAAETKRLGAVVDYLAQTAGRMGRKDWFLLAVALCTWAVPPAKAAAFAQAVIHVLQWIIHLPPLLP